MTLGKKGGAIAKRDRNTQRSSRCMQVSRGSFPRNIVLSLLCELKSSVVIECVRPLSCHSQP